MPNAINTQWFVDRLSEKRMSQRGLARTLGLDSSAVSLMFRGRRQMKLTEAADIARLLGVPLDDVLHHAGVHEATKGARASVVGFVDQHQEVHIVKPEFSVDAPPGMPDGAGAIQSRAGDFTDGWLYFLAPPRGVNPESFGRFSLVKISGGVGMLAKVRKSYIPGRYSLEGVMSADDVELELAEPIIQIVT